MTSHSDTINRITSDNNDPEQTEADMAERPYIAPRTPTEKWLADTVAEWLELEHVSIDDDFFELGGDSLKALRILSRVRDKFQVELPGGVLFSVQFTVLEIARLIDQYELDAIDPEELNVLINELGELSDEDAKARLSDDEK